MTVTATAINTAEPSEPSAGAGAATRYTGEERTSWASLRMFEVVLTSFLWVQISEA